MDVTPPALGNHWATLDQASILTGPHTRSNTIVTILFETHATTVDNEANLAAGWYDIELSRLGEAQAEQLGVRRSQEHFDVIFCSDLQRSYNTARIAFGDKFPIIQDERLRECDYGTLNHAPKNTVEALREQALTTPYPGGESYNDTAHRMRMFLQDILERHDGETIMIIGHRATQYGLDRWIKDMSLREAVLAPWHWQPGWKYELARDQLENV